MKRLFVVTAVTEAGAGAGLMCFPSILAALILGSPLDTSASVAVGRLAGAAVFALAVANWFARRDPSGPAATGLVTAMVLYNVGTVVILGAAGVWSPPTGPLLWPVVVVHAAMTVWCIASLSGARPASK
jgi:hypothetical protein